MFKNCWYAVEFSNLISTSPKLLKILNREVVLYRTSDGRIQAMNNTFVHRGAALVNGSIAGNCIVCPYHGWHYQPDGICVKIPANSPTATIPKQTKMTTYPVCEKYGWIWLFIGDGEVSELPIISRSLSAVWTIDNLDGTRSDDRNFTWEHRATYDRQQVDKFPHFLQR